MVCLDRVSFCSFIKIFFSGERSALVLEDFKKNSLTNSIFKVFGIKLIQAKFFAGNLKNSNSKCIPFDALKIANLQSVRIAKKHVEDLNNIDFLYEFLKKDALIIHYAKKLLPEINRLILNVKVAENLNLDNKILVRSSLIISSEDINDIAKNNNIEVYTDYSNIIYQLIEKL